MIPLDDHEFYRAVEYVRAHYGINLEKKMALVQARLSLDIERKGYRSFKEYFDKVFAAPQSLEAQQMIDKISTNHTFFFREPSCFEHMKKAALPELLKRGTKQISIWSAAASTGQECYSIAMLLDDYLRMHKTEASFRIVGTDINSQVLRTAADGVYPQSEFFKIPSLYRSRYCIQRSDGFFEICADLKSRISWHKNNLVDPKNAVFRYHLIFCRNVMIYFDAPTKQRLMQRLHRAIYDDGYLYLGGTETVDPGRKYFTYISPSIFLKNKVTQYEC